MKPTYKELLKENEKLRDKVNSLIKAKENKKELLIETTSLPYAILIYDDKGKVHALNTKFTGLFGYTIKDIPNLEKWFQLSFPDSKYRFDQSIKWFKTLKKTGNRKKNTDLIEARITCKNGLQREAEISFDTFGEEYSATFIDISKRKNVEEALRNSQKTLTRITSTIDDALYSINGQTGEFEYISPVFKRKFGYSLDDIEQMGGRWSFLSKIILDEDAPKLDPVMNDLQRKKIKETPVWEHWWRCKDGSVLYIEDRSVPIYDGNRLVRIDGVLRDITEREHAEAALRKSEAQLSNAVKIAHLGPWEYDVIKDLFKFNDSFYAIYRTTVEEVGSYTMSSIEYAKRFVHPEAVQIVSLEILKAIETEDPYFSRQFEHRIVYADGEIGQIAVRFFIIKDDKGRTIKTYGVNQDITERKNREDEVKRNNRKLECLLRISQFKVETTKQFLDYAINEAMELTESKLGFIYIYDENINQFKLNSYKWDVMKEGTTVNFLNIYEQKKAIFWNKALRLRKPIIENNYEYNKQQKKVIYDENIYLKKFLIIPVVVDDKIVTIIGVANKKTDYDNTDIQQLSILMDSVWKMVEKQKYQEELIIAKEKAEESDKLKSAFLANMSHEIRTPMNSIIGFSEFLLKPSLTDEKRKKYTGIMVNSCNQLLNIVNDILDISLIESSKVDIKKENINVNNVIFDLFAIYNNAAQSKKISLHFHNQLDDKSSIIYTDKTRLSQILNNLINNALKFTSKGQIDFGYKFKKDYFEFYVKDTGIGIPKDMHNKIFERFRQAELELARHYGGTGLGLSISKSLVELLGGKIWIISKPGKGTTFFFTIPYEKVTDDTKENVVLQIEEGNKLTINQPLTILVAEDEEYNYLYLEEVLADSRINLLHAYDGIEAVELCKKNRDINLVLMDIKMPKMNGIIATKKIKKIRPDLRVIALTAFANENEKKYVSNEGCDDYISKPINTKLLFEKILQNLDPKKFK